ncbi:MAG: Ubiquinone biosynthesis O-methyltransferase [Planctomycetota bacterium]
MNFANGRAAASRKPSVSATTPESPKPDRPATEGPDIGVLARRLFTDGPLLARLLQHHRHRIAPIARCVELVPEGSDILDIGCGGGLFLALLAATGRIRSGRGIDSSAPAIEVARRALPRIAGLTPSATVAFEHRAVEAGLPEGRFPVVAMIDVMHHIPPAFQRQAFDDALSRVAPGGVFLYKDMCDAPVWRAGMNRLHDLVMARQWIRYLPIERADEWARAEGFAIEVAEERAMLWYGHEIRLYRRRDA